MRYNVWLDLHQSGAGRSCQACFAVIMAETTARSWPLCFNGRTVSFIAHTVFCLEGKIKAWFQGVSSITPSSQMPYTVAAGRLSMPRDALGPSFFFSLNWFLFLYYIFSLPSTLIIHLYMKLHCEIFMTVIWEQLCKTKWSMMSVHKNRQERTVV